METHSSRLIDQFHKVLALIDIRASWLLALLAVLTVVISALEVVSVTAIFPLLKILLDSEQLNRWAALQPYLPDIAPARLVVIGCIVLFIVFLTKVALSVFAVWLKWLIQARLYRDISVRLFSAYLAAPVSFHLRRNASELQRNLNVYVNQFTQFGCLGLVDLVGDVLLGLGIFVALFLIEPTVSIIAVLSIGVISAFYIGFGQSYFLAWSRQLKEASARMFRLALESITGIKTIKVVGREQFFIDKYRQSVSDYCATMRKNAVAAAIPRQALELIAVGALVAIISWAVLSGKDAKALIPVLAVFAAAAYRLIPAFVRVTRALQNFRFSHDAVETIHGDITGLSSTSLHRAARVHKRSHAGEIVLRDATFAYAEAPRAALEAVNIVIHSGEAVALVGTSGAGKTTLADVILGLHKLTSGTMTIDGLQYTDPEQIPRGLFGYVPQDPFLIDDTILHNIALGEPDDEIDEDRVRAVLKTAALDRHIAALPMGVQTVVGDRGVRLSGGQRQRIGIARALYVDPEFLVLDEATSSVDMTTEAEITEAINRLRRVKTVIVIAHRLSTVRECDRILFMKEGRVVAEGTYEQLVRKNDEFAGMVHHLEDRKPQLQPQF